jgi:hypothetical protein
MSNGTDVKTPESSYRSLYRLSGAAALIVAFLTVIEIVAFFIYPPPNTVHGWFILFQSNPIFGVLDFWGLEVLMYAMFAIVFLALHVALRNVSKSGMTIALTSALLGIAIFFATNNPFSMLSLSNQFATATTETHRSALLAAGEAILVNTNQRAVGGFNLGLFLVSIAGLISSSVMIRAHSFSRFTAYLGILAFGMSLADFLRQVFTSAVLIALLVIVPGALLLVLWFVLVGRKLLRLGCL